MFDLSNEEKAAVSTLEAHGWSLRWQVHPSVTYSVLEVGVMAPLLTQSVVNGEIKWERP